MDNISINNNLRKLFIDWSGKNPDKTEILPHSGSSRTYFRFFTNDLTVLGAYNENRNENLAFLTFTDHFLKCKLKVPEIYARDISNNCYLIEDFGTLDLLSWLNKTRIDQNIPPEIIQFYKTTLKELLRFQIFAGKDLDYSMAYPFKIFDKEAILFDLHYFMNQFVIPGKYEFNITILNQDFNLFADYLLTERNDFFMYRDFQARNIMVKNNIPCFIDYQGGRKGPLQYDVASLLYQAKANLPEDIREELLTNYIHEAQSYIQFDKNKFIEYYYAFAFLRIMQTLGAYGLRGLVERKTHFIESIVPALKNLKLVSQKVHILNKTNELKKLIIQITNKSNG